MALSVNPQRRAGRGEPVVLLHDLGLTWHSWGRCVELLARTYDVFAPTLPGHWGGPGLPGPVTLTTLLDAVERQLDEAELDRVHLVGNGFGAWIAAGLARRGRAGSLTAIAPLGLWHNDPATAAAVRAELRRRSAVLPLLGLIRNPVAGPMAQRAALRSLTGRSAPAMLDLCEITRRRAVVTIEAPLHCAVMNALVDTPEFARGWHPVIAESPRTTVITSGRDRLLPRPVLVADPRVHTEHLPEHGHVPMLDDPDLIARAIRDTIGGAPWLPNTRDSTPAPRRPATRLHTTAPVRDHGRRT
ncbi:alpha/beta fold hydrolase [Nocardia sp. SSK8]|uniref:alpha/beta fold hydrolase n=1 Tax=Nocardia sp. SSK8 TaxID=3120154 RepID=UPI00300AE54A